MGVVSHELEFTSPLPPTKIFKALILHSDNLIPKLMPQAIKSIEVIEGDGGPGSIKKITFAEGSHFKYVKHRVDGIDKENLSFSYSLIEGDALSDKLEKISNEVKFEPSADGGTICKNVSKYYTIGEFEIKEEDIKAGKERAMGMFKAVEAYLLANPDAYSV